MGSVGQVHVPQVVAPGERVEIVAAVRNDAATVQRVVGRLTGPVAAWADAAEQAVNLFGGTEGTLTFQLNVPARIDTSGDIHFALTAFDEQSSESVELVVTVLGQPAIAAVLRPVTARRLRGSRHRLTVANTGNRVADVTLAAEEPDDLLDLRVTPERLELPPHTEADAKVRTRALTYPRKGEMDRLPFTVTASWDGGASTADGALQQRRRRIPAWIKLAAFLAIVSLIGASAYATAQAATPILGGALADDPPKAEPRPTNKAGETRTALAPPDPAAVSTTTTSATSTTVPISPADPSGGSSPNVVVGPPVAPGGDTAGAAPGAGTTGGGGASGSTGTGSAGSGSTGTGSVGTGGTGTGSVGTGGTGTGSAGTGGAGTGGTGSGGTGTGGSIGTPGTGGTGASPGGAPGTGGSGGTSPGFGGGSTADRATGLVTPTALMVLLDLSSSMTETDGDGRLKLDGAKAAVNSFLKDVPPTTLVGLWTYPGAGDCSAGTLRISPRPADTATMSATVRAMAASGNTPTADALRSAAEALPSTGPRTIVLISDGESNCNKAPCPVAEELAQRGIDLSINTIGFRISDAGRSELNCIANAARGRYKDVQNAADLAGELRLQSRTTLQMAVSSPAVVTASAVTAPGGGVEITATVRNIGPLLAHDVEAYLRYNAERSPGAAIPRRRLGNLQPGESRTATWTFRPLVEFKDVRVGFEVSASSENADTLLRQGSVNVTGALRAGDGGPLLAGRPRVAILGDSYSSGEGTFDYLGATDTATNTCHRSGGTYGSGEVFAQRYVFACSGAVSADVYNQHPVLRDPSNPSKPLRSQVDQLAGLDEPPDVALMTLGGNDVGFRGLILSCLLPGECVQSQRQALADALTGLPDSLADAYSAIDSTLNSQRARLRRGRIAPLIVLPYPQLFPDRPLVRSDCSKLLSSAEISFANDVARRLNQVIASTVARLRSTGMPIWFASDVAKAFLPDHTMCDEIPWVNYVDLGDVTMFGNDVVNRFFDGLYGFPTPDDPAARRILAAFHPKDVGYQAMTAALIRWSSTAAGIEAAAGLGDLDRAPTPPASVGAPVRTLALTTGRSVGSLERGATYDVVASGLPPRGVADVRFRSGVRVLARGRADEQGVLRTPIVIPLGAELGEHRLEVRSVTPGVAPVVDAPARVGEVRPSRRGVVLGAGGGLGAAGLLLTVTGRARLARMRRTGRPIKRSGRRRGRSRVAT